MYIWDNELFDEIRVGYKVWYQDADCNVCHGNAITPYRIMGNIQGWHLDGDNEIVFPDTYLGHIA